MARYEETSGLRTLADVVSGPFGLDSGAGGNGVWNSDTGFDVIESSDGAVVKLGAQISGYVEAAKVLSGNGFSFGPDGNIEEAAMVGENDANGGEDACGSIMFSKEIVRTKQTAHKQTSRPVPNSSSSSHLPRRRTRPTQRASDEHEPSQSPPTYDATRFISQAAEEYYIAHSSRHAIIERGLDCIAPYDTQIRARGWARLCDPQGEAILPLVREFYANFKESEGDNVFVRGRRVKISCASINALFSPRYRVDDANLDGFRCFLKGAEFSWDTVLRGVAQPTTKWTMKGSVVASFPASELTLPHKVWFRFIASTLMPTSHVTVVTADRAALLYAIVHGIPIDLGHLISRQMQHCVTHSKVKGWYFPLVVTRLCSQAGVEIQPGEQCLSIPPAWGETTIAQFRSFFRDGQLALPRQPRPAPRSAPRQRRTVPDDLPQQMRDDNRRMWRHQMEVNQMLYAAIGSCSCRGDQPLPPLPPCPIDLSSPHKDNGDDSEDTANA